MAEVKVETEITAPLKEVFDYVANLETHTIYAGHFVKSLKITSAKKVGKGVTFKQTHHGSDREIDTEITDYVPNYKITWVTHGGLGDVLVNYFFSETPGGTKVVHTITSKAWDDPRLFKETYDSNAIELANLKKVMEGN